MKKIGFIDYFLNEWHADNYPEMIKKASDGEFEVCYAYAYTEPPVGSNKLSNAQWAEEHGVELLSSIEEVIEKSDLLIVLSPDNPEMHEELCKLPLASGKLTYVDKTFAPDKEAAKRIFANAEAHNTPCFSTSALRFAAELANFDKDNICRVYTEGPSSLSIYSIHQIEPMVSLMNCHPLRVMYLGDEKHPSYLVEFENGKVAQAYHRNNPGMTFRFSTVNAENRAVICDVTSNFFALFIDALVEFFRTGVAPVPHEQTIDVIAIRTAVIEAAQTPYQWVNV